MYNIEEQKNLIDVKAGDLVEGCYFLKNSVVKSTKNSTFFLDTILVDNSMSSGISAKLWDIAADYIAPEAGNIVYITFTAETYDGNIQGRIKKIMIVDISNVKKERLVKIVEKVLPTSPIDIDKEWNYITNTIASFKDVGLQKLVMNTIEEVGVENFETVSAARGVHHWERCGLLAHTSEMLHMADGILPLFPTIDVDIVRAGIILHDIEKIDEYLFSMYGLVSDFTVRGNLLGHLCMGVMLVDKVGRKINELNEETMLHIEGIIGSHHGKPEYGCIKYPATPEALLVSELDGMSAQMYQYINVQNNIESGTFSEAIRTLDGARIWRPASKI